MVNSMFVVMICTLSAALNAVEKPQKEQQSYHKRNLPRLQRGRWRRHLTMYA